MGNRPFVKHILLLCAALCCFVALKFATEVLVLSSCIRMTIDVEMDHKDTVELFASPHLRFQDYESRGAVTVRARKRAVKEIILANKLNRNLRLDLGDKPGETRIHEIAFISYFGPPVVFRGPDILERFQGNEHVAGMSLEGDAAVVRAQGNDPFITLREPLVVKNFFIAWILPLAHSFIFYLFLTRFNFREYPAFKDITGKVSSSGANYGALDGMRGLAALTVLGEHTGVFKGTGWLGILWFFCLSGFLLTQPFVREPRRAVSFSYMCDYIARRLKRVLPMFYVMITLLFLFRNRVVEAFRHYSFVQADGVLWTVPQELFFYFWLPFIVLAVYVFFFAGGEIPSGCPWARRLETGLAAFPFLAVTLFAFCRLPIRWTAADVCFWGLFVASVPAALFPELGRRLRTAVANLLRRPGGIPSGRAADFARALSGAFCAVFRPADKRVLAALFLIELTYIAFRYLTVDVIALYGNGILGAPRIGAFLCGALFAYLGAMAADARKERRGPWARLGPVHFSRAGLILYVALLALSWGLVLLPQLGCPLPEWLLRCHPRWHSGVYSCLSGVLILLAVFAGVSRFAAVVGCLPLRALGVVSFSFYLLHPLVIDIVKTVNRTLFNHVHPPHIAMFVIVGVLTYVLSTITYTWIERPFVRK